MSPIFPSATALVTQSKKLLAELSPANNLPSATGKVGRVVQAALFYQFIAPYSYTLGFAAGLLECATAAQNPQYRKYTFNPNQQLHSYLTTLGKNSPTAGATHAATGLVAFWVIPQIVTNTLLSGLGIAQGHADAHDFVHLCREGSAFFSKLPMRA